MGKEKKYKNRASRSTAYFSDERPKIVLEA